MLPRLVRALAAATAFLIAAVAAHAFPTPLPGPNLAERDFRNGAVAVDAATLAVIGIGPSGSSYVAGTFTSVDGHARPHGLVRLNLDGTVDTAWAPTLPANRPNVAFESATGAVALGLGSDLILVPAGTGVGTVIHTPSPSLGLGVAAFDASGSLYAGFNSRVSPPAGTSIDAEVFKFSPTGVRDTAFELRLGGTYDNCFLFSGPVTLVGALLPLNGHLYVGGSFRNSANARGSWTIGGAIRVSAASGDVDPTWHPMGDTAASGSSPPTDGSKLTCFPNPTGTVTDILAGPGQTVYLGGGYERQGRRKLGRFSTNAPGTVDSAWVPPPLEGSPGFPLSPATIVRIALDPAGDFIYAAVQAKVGGMDRNGLAAISTGPGAPVSHWDPNANPVTRMVATAGRLVIGGAFTAVAGEPRPHLAALPRPDASPTGPLITMSPRLIDVGNVPVGSVVTRDLAVGNAGDAPLTIGQIVNLFSWTQTNDCGPSLAPGAGCTIRLRLEVDGDCCQLDLIVPSNAGGTPQVVRISWRPTYAQLAQRIPINFGSTPPGLSRTSTFVVRNVGIEGLRVTGVTVADANRPGEFTHSNDCPVSLAFGATCNILVTYTPQAAGAASANLRLSFGTPTMVGNLSDLVLETTASITGTGATAGDDSDGDGLTNGLEATLGRNPLVKDNDVFGSGNLFAMQQYRDFLGREGDAGGINFWTQQLGSGATTRSLMAENFLASAEFQGVIAPVARLYFAYFFRFPDYGGLSYWVGQHRAGQSLEAISDAFATSYEFTGRYGTLDNAGFVDRVYRNLFARVPDAAGLAHWTGRLDGGMTRGQMMVAFSESPENRALVGTEVLVTMCYVGMLQRGPDGAGFNHWVGYVDQGNSLQALIGAFLAAPEYRARFLP